MLLSNQSLKRVALVCGLCALYPGLSLGHDPNLRSFHTRDGLAHDVVRDIVQAFDGTLWFATFGGGISHFDGREWTTFDRSQGLASNDVRVLFPDGKKGMWAGTTEGIAYFDGVTWSTVTPTIPGLSKPSVFCVARLDKGTLWFGTAGGRILELRRDHPRTDSKPERITVAEDARAPQEKWSIVLDTDLTEGKAVRDILQLADGEIWAAIDGVGIAVHDRERWRLRWGEDAVDTKIFSLFQTHDGSVWTAGGLVLQQFDGQKWSRVPQAAPGPVCVAESRSGELFVGTRDGLWIRREGDWESVPLGDDAPHPRVETVSCLSDGSTWIGTQHGAYQIGSMPWLLYDQTADGVRLTGRALYTDPDTPPLSVDVRGRLVQFNGEVWEPITLLHPDAPLDEVITRPHRNRIWILFKGYEGREGRAMEFALDRNSLIRSVPIPREIKAVSLFQSRAGRPYLLSKTGVYELVEGQWEPRPADPNYNRRFVRSVDEDQQGRLWLELEETVECWEENKIEPFVLEGDISVRHRVSAIYCARDGRIWFGTYGSGLVSWDGESYRQYTAPEGLLSDLVSTIYQAFDGTLWVGAKSLGVSSYRDGRWVCYTHAEGLEGRRVRAIGEYPKGVIWIALQNGGLACYRPTEEGPETAIGEYQQTIAPQERGVFTFSGLDTWHLTPREDLVFSWRILPRSAAPEEVLWSAFSPDTVVVTPRLEPGWYTFEVRTADKDRNIDPTPAQADFKVLLPVWRTAEFLVPVSILLVIAVIAVAFAYKRHRDLEIRVEERTAQLAKANEELRIEITDRKQAEALLRRSEEEERRFQDQLKVLHRVGNELSKEASFDDLCRRAVELGCSRLGFDRLGIWFLDHADPDVIVGSFGVDENGQIRDERGQRIPLRKFPAIRQVCSQEIRVILFEDQPLFNERGEEVGRGSNAIAGIWDGRHFIGFVAMDNLLHQQPITERECELFGLYASTVGHLCSLKRAEEALEKSEQLYRGAIEVTGAVPYYQNYITNTYEFVGPGIQSLVGYSPEEFTPEVWQSITEEIILLGNLAGLSPDEAVQRARRGEGVSWRADYRVRTPGGEERWIANAAVQKRDNQGKVVGSLGVLQDITERRRLETAILKTSEREQRRIGQDLHDDLGQHLTGVAFMSEVLEEKLTAKALPEAPDAARIAEQIRAALAHAYALARGLCPVELDEGGLMSALRQLASDTQSLFGISCLFQCEKPLLVRDNTVANHLYRIVQEAVNNAIKHGKATHILIDLTTVDDWLTLRVKDDGVGLTAERKKSKGMGLPTMRYRASTIGASLDVRQDSDGGTSVIVRCKV